MTFLPCGCPPAGLLPTDHTGAGAGPARPLPRTPPPRRSTRRPVWQISYLSGLAASVIIQTRAPAARAAAVPTRAAGLGPHHATPITAGMFAMGTMIVTFWFTFAVILMRRR